MPEIDIQAFNGGINNIVEDHLLDTHFSKDLRNCRINDGAITNAVAPKVFEGILDPGLKYQTGNRSLLKFGTNYYWSDNDTGELDSSLGYMGVTTPLTKPAATQGVIGGRFPSGSIYKYLYTYRTVHGFRSAPFSVITPEIFAAPRDLGTIVVRGFDVSIPSEVSDVEIWRTVAGGADYFLAGSVSRWSDGDPEYTDKTLDLTLLENERLDTTSVAGKPGSGRYLTERNSIFYIADGDRVYYSESANPHQYGSLSFITFDDDITAMISTENFTLVFTRNRAYQLTGNSIADIAKGEIPDSQGVKNWQTVSRIKNMPVWISNDGLCSYQPYDNRSGRKITVLSQNIFKVPDGPISAMVANDIYYLFYANETIAFDFLQGMAIYRLDWIFDWAWYDRNNDRIIGKKDAVYYDAEGGDELEFEYLSLEFTAGDMQRLKRMGRMFVDSTEELEFTFYKEGVEAWNFTLKHTGVDQRRQFISPLVQGRRIQVRIQGKGTLRGLTFEYEMKRL